MGINYKAKYELAKKSAARAIKHTKEVGPRMVQGGEMLAGNAAMNYMAHRTNKDGEPKILGFPAALVVGGLGVLGGLLIKKRIGADLAALGFGAASQYTGERAAVAGAKARDAAANAKTSGRAPAELNPGGLSNASYAQRAASVVR